MRGRSPTRWLIGGDVPEPQGNRHPTVSPYGAFGCQDGIVQIAVGNDTIWRRFAPLVGPDPDDERFRRNGDRVANDDALSGAIGSALAHRPIAHWMSVFAEAGVPAGEVRPLDEVHESEQVKSQELVVETLHSTLGPIRLPGSPLRFDGGGRRLHAPPPTYGEHSDTIRAWLAEAATRPAP